MMAAPALVRRSNRIWWLVIALVAIAVARIVATYWTFNHTIDEPTHIACGLEWLTDHEYTIDLEHPPLARIAAGIGPFIVGAHIPPKDQLATKGPLILYDSPSYYRTLASARAGELPFFILACLIVWLWGRRVYGRFVGLLAVVLFTTLPPILGHAGLATTDMAIGATLPAALYALNAWCEKCTWKTTTVLSIAIGMALLSKITFFLFFPVCGLLIILLQCFQRKITRAHFLHAFAATGGVFLLVWAAYWFSIVPVPTNGNTGGSSASLPAFVKTVTEDQGVLYLPAGQLYLGILQARAHNYYGHLTYLLGKSSTSGWWYFFPVVLGNKTPLAFLALCLAFPWVFRRAARAQWVPFACAIAIFISVLPSRIDLGIRHILPMYPLLAISAGGVAGHLLEARSRLVKAVCAVALCWHIGSSIVAHPNYLAYFNELSFGEPEYVRVDSDLDWGQSVEQLSRWTRKERVGQIGFAGFGSTNPSLHGLDFYSLSPWKHAYGWIAVSATERMLPSETQQAGARGQAWSWLDSYEPTLRLGGGSILVYHIPASQSPKPRN